MSWEAVTWAVVPASNDLTAWLNAISVTVSTSHLSCFCFVDTDHITPCYNRACKMADFVRRLVSGNKARFKDGELDLELGTPELYQKSRTRHLTTAGRPGIYH